MARAKHVEIERRGNLTLRESLIYAGVGYSRAKKLINSGEWNAFPLGKEIRVIKTSIDDWQSRQAQRYARSGR